MAELSILDKISIVRVSRSELRDACPKMIVLFCLLLRISSGLIIKTGTYYPAIARWLFRTFNCKEFSLVRNIENLECSIHALERFVQPP